MPAKAIALLSGGLDSILAARVVKDLGVEVLALTFDTGFFSLQKPGEVPEGGSAHPWLKRVEPVLAEAGILVEVEDVSGEFLRMLVKPAHGYGAHYNPCIDCKILFLSRARQRLEAWGGDFLVTGEVLGQRPMSQNLNALNLIEKAAGVTDILLRPLSARCLEPTKPEREGLIDRERLLAFSGRTRKPQMELAARLGIQEYSQPAGGCILTDENFSRRFSDQLQHRPQGVPLNHEEVTRLRLGRHFRLPGGGKVIVGRHEQDNDLLLRYRQELSWLLPVDIPGPVALVEENGDAAAFAFALGAVARYSDFTPGQPVRVEWHRGEASGIEQVEPLDDQALEVVRI